MAQNSQRYKILVVDDEWESPIVASVVRRLEREGWQPIVVKPTTKWALGDEFEAVLDTNQDGIDTMIVRVEHPEHAKPDAVVAAVQNEIASRIEVRVGVEVLAPGTLPKTEFKAKRIIDRRDKS